MGPPYNKDPRDSRQNFFIIMRLCNIEVPFHIFTINGTKKIEDFVIYTGFSYRGSTVCAKHIGTSKT